MKFLPTIFKVWLLKLLYKDIASLGVDGDTELAHINKWESNLLIAHGGSGTINTLTGLKEYKGGGGGQTQTTNQNIDPAILPYITYGLEEAKDLYDESIELCNKRIETNKKIGKQLLQSLCSN